MIVRPVTTALSCWGRGRGRGREGGGGGGRLVLVCGISNGAAVARYITTGACSLFAPNGEPFVPYNTQYPETLFQIQPGPPNWYGNQGRLLLSERWQHSGARHRAHKTRGILVAVFFNFDFVPQKRFCRHHNIVVLYVRTSCRRNDGISHANDRRGRTVTTCRIATV